MFSAGTDGKTVAGQGKSTLDPVVTYALVLFVIGALLVLPVTGSPMLLALVGGVCVLGVALIKATTWVTAWDKIRNK